MADFLCAKLCETSTMKDLTFSELPRHFHIHTGVLRFDVMFDDKTTFPVYGLDFKHYCKKLLINFLLEVFFLQ